MDFDSPKVYGDTSISAGLVFLAANFFLREPEVLPAEMVAVVVLLPWGIHCNLHKLEILIQSPTSVLLQVCSHVRLVGSSDCLDGQDGEYLLS